MAVKKKKFVSRKVRVISPVYAEVEELFKNTGGVLSKDAEKNYEHLQTLDMAQLDNLYVILHANELSPDAVKSKDKDTAFNRVVRAVTAFNTFAIPTAVKTMMTEEDRRKANEVIRKREEESKKIDSLETVFRAMYRKHGFELTTDAEQNSKNLCSLSKAALDDLHYGVTLSEVKPERKQDTVRRIMEKLSGREWALFGKIKYHLIGEDEMSTSKKVKAKAKSKVKSASKSSGGSKSVAEKSTVEVLDGKKTVVVANEKIPALPVRKDLKSLVPAGAKGISVSLLTKKAAEKLKLAEAKIHKHLQAMVKKGFIVIK